MDIVFLIGRILFAMIFMGSGIGHLTDESSAQYAEAKGLPSPKLMAQISGVALLAGGLGIIFGVLMDQALLGMAVLVLIMAFTMHAFWKEGPETRQMEMSMFMKNLSITGGAVIICAAALNGADLGPMLTDPLFG